MNIKQKLSIEIDKKKRRLNKYDQIVNLVLVIKFQCMTNKCERDEDIR